MTVAEIRRKTRVWCSEHNEADNLANLINQLDSLTNGRLIQ